MGVAVTENAGQDQQGTILVVRPESGRVQKRLPKLLGRKMTESCKGAKNEQH